MRYQIEIFLNGQWTAQAWSASVRFAELKAIQLIVSWRKFNLNVRIIDTETGDPVPFGI